MKQNKYNAKRITCEHGTFDSKKEFKRFLDLPLSLHDKYRVTKAGKTTLLKNLANELFDKVEEEARQCQLAESSVVYANRDRNHQNDVHQQLSILENCFYNGDFLKVYHDANAIYSHSHVEDDNGAR